MPAQSVNVVPVGNHPPPLSWRNVCALTISTVLGFILTIVLSPFLLAAATCLWCSKFLGGK